MVNITFQFDSEDNATEFYVWWQHKIQAQFQIDSSEDDWSYEIENFDIGDELVPNSLHAVKISEKLKLEEAIK